MQAELDDAGIVRVTSGLKHIQRDDGGAILLTQAGRYIRIGPHAWQLVRTLSHEPCGETVVRAKQIGVQVNLQPLVANGVLDYQPIVGDSVDPRLTARLWSRNVYWRGMLRLRGWSAFARLLTPRLNAMVPIPSSRPRLFDQIEASARTSLGLPGTSAQCTVVAAAVRDCLSALGYPARVVLLGSADQLMFHARTYVGGHGVDPADVLIDLTPFNFVTPF